MQDSKNSDLIQIDLKNKEARMQRFKRLSKVQKAEKSKRIALVWKNMFAKTNALLKTTSFATATSISKVTTISVLSSTLFLTGCSSFIAANTGTQPVGIESSDRSFSQVLLDNSIERTASINMYKLDSRFKQSRVNITSFHSVALLTGQVPDAHLKQVAEDNLKAMSDVKAVQNYLTVGDEIGYAQIVQDGITTATVRKNFLLLKGFKDSRVKVVTENNVVYLMGKLPKSDIEWLIDTLQRTSSIAKIVSLIDVLPEVAPSIQPSTPVENKPLSSAAVVNSTSLNSDTVTTPVAIDPMVSTQPLIATGSSSFSTTSLPK